jgi:hypothetical protein
VFPYGTVVVYFVVAFFVGCGFSAGPLHRLERVKLAFVVCRTVRTALRPP